MSKGGSSSTGAGSGSGATGRGGSGNNEPISQEEQDISRSVCTHFLKKAPYFLICHYFPYRPTRTTFLNTIHLFGKA